MSHRPETRSLNPDENRPAKRLRMANALSVATTGTGLVMKNEMEERKSVYEWLLGYQNALRAGIGFGLERFQVSRKQAIEFLNVEDWWVHHLCADNGGEQLGGVLAAKRRYFFVCTNDFPKSLSGSI